MIIGISGDAGSGKTTLGRALQGVLAAHRYGFTGNQTQLVMYVQDFMRDSLPYAGALSKHPIRKFAEGVYACVATLTGKSVPWIEENKTVFNTAFSMTYRQLLEHVGMRLRDGREDFWVASLKSNLEDSVIIDDVRFENEVALIRSRGGIIIFVERGEPSGYESAKQLSNIRIKADYRVVSDGIPDLIVTADRIVHSQSF